MSIHFRFTMKPKRRLFKKEELKFETVMAAIKAMESEEQLRLEEFQGGVKVTLCPEGYIEILYKKAENMIHGDCQTHIAGPGFHAAAIALLEKLSKVLYLKLKLDDDTDYSRDKDFEKMQREHFYPWLKHILTLVCSQYSKSDYCLCWDLDSYTPEVIPGTVVTPIRRFTINEFKEYYEQDIKYFARDFFVWNNTKRDAWFYRNSALMEMNVGCYFMFSERSIWDGIENGLCLINLEKALQYDIDVPFPVPEYRLLCRLHGQPPVDLDGVVEMRHECEIGYRRGMIIHSVGQFTYSVYGDCLERMDRSKNTMIYYDDRPGRYHRIKLTSFHIKGKYAEFVNDVYQKIDVESSLEFRVGEGVCRLDILKQVPLKETPEGYQYEMSAQMLLDGQLLLVNQTYQRKEETSDIIQWFQSFNGKRRA